MRWSVCPSEGFEGFEEPPCARMGHIAVSVDASEVWGDELVIIHGGLGEDKHALRDVVVLESSNEAWFRPEPATGTGPAARAFHCAAALGSKVYVFGGHVYVKEKKGLHKFNDVWCLDVDTWEWSAVEVQADAVKPPARDFARMVVLEGGRLLLFGGLDIAERRLDDVWIFDLALSSWSEVKVKGPKPKGRYGHSLTAVEQRVLLFGGETASGLMSDLWALRGLAPDGAEAAAWAPLDLPGAVPSPRKGHAVALAGSQLVVMGGHTAEIGWFRNRTDIFHKDVVVLEREGPVQWRAPEVEGEGPAPREHHTITPLSTSRLLVFGGGNGKEMFADAWWLELDAGSAAASPAMQQALPGGQGQALLAAADAGPAERKAPLAGLGLASRQRQQPAPGDTVQRTASGRTSGSIAAQLAQLGLETPSGSWSLDAAGAQAVVVAANALQMERLCTRLGLPPQPHMAAPLPAPAPALLQQDEEYDVLDLGEELLEEESQGEPSGPALESDDVAMAAARAYLTNTAATHDLRLKDINALWTDYERVVKVAVSSMLQQQDMSAAVASFAAAQGVQGRFMHLGSAAELRIADIAALQQDYSSILAAQH